MSSGSSIQIFEERFAAKMSGGGMGFDPTIIIAIISALIPLISGCFNPKPAALRRRLGNRARLAAAIKRENREVSWPQAFAQAENVFELADAATDEELKGFIGDCCDGGNAAVSPAVSPTA